jgi:hypothetical protein
MKKGIEDVDLGTRRLTLCVSAVCENAAGKRKNRKAIVIGIRRICGYLLE